MSEREVIIDYTNWRGERSLRRISPVSGGLTFGSTQWHPHAQWLMAAIDLDRLDKPVRQFAMSSIHSWRDV